MKKIFLSLAMSVMAVAACQKPEIDQQFSEDEHATFTASVESFDSQTKTSMTPEKHVVWSQNDRLAIFQGSTLADEYKVTDESAGKANGTFSIVSDGSSLNGDFSAGTELPCNVAFYPYADGLSLVGAALEDEGVAYRIDGVVLPAEQTYAEGSFANGAFPMAAVTETMADHNLKFKNVLGALKLQLKGTQVVKFIRVEGNNGEVLSGSASVTAYSDNSVPAISMTATDDASKSVTLNCGDGVQLSAAVPTSFLIALPPVVFTEGFTVTVTDSEGKVITLKARVENTILRSSILAMLEVELGSFENIAPDTIDYIDEYGINHGPGVKIYGVIWSPVNCGYHATDYQYGKLYQWGRKYGQGYDGELYDGESNCIGEYADAISPEFIEGPVSMDTGQSEDNASLFYMNLNEPYDWIDVQDDNLWNSGTEENPVKTEYDPCPNGWRVPTFAELFELSRHKSEWTTNTDGQAGYWFSGAATCFVDTPQVFVPAAGNVGGFDYDVQWRGAYGGYWSSRSDDIYASYICFDLWGTGWGAIERSFGYSIRCVHESSAIISPSEDDYVDEYGVNHGPGVKIDEIVWAPVNCGYHATDYKWGKLYQWGRKYGQGYRGGGYNDATAPEFVALGPVSLSVGQSEDCADVFFSPNSDGYDGYDWVIPSDDNLWNSGSEDVPIKTDYDPCPNGWRVPTYAELNGLQQNKSAWTTNADGQTGYWFSGATVYSQDIPQVFFPAAGYRYYSTKSFYGELRGVVGKYWSSRSYSGAYDSHALDLYFREYGSEMSFAGSARASGYSLRCVHE